MAEIKDIKEIKITPNGKGGVDLFINGEKIDLRNVTGLRLDVLRNEGGNGVLFEFSAKQRICFLQDYEYCDLRGKNDNEDPDSNAFS